MSDEDDNSNSIIINYEEDDGFTIEEHPLPSLEELGCSLSDSEYIDISDDNEVEPSKDYYDPYADDEKIFISSVQSLAIEENGVDEEQQPDEPPEEQEETNDNDSSHSQENESKEKTEEIISEAQAAKEEPYPDEPPQLTRVKSQPRQSRFECDVCNFVSWTNFGLVQHMKTHSNSKPKTQHTVETLSATKIKIVNSSPKKYSCKECTFTADAEEAFNEHLKEHKTMLSCDRCSYETQSDNIRNFFAHFIKKHPTLCTRCVACKRRYPGGMEKEHAKSCRKNKLHRETNEINTKRFRCKFCSFTNTAQMKMMKHLKLHTVRKEPILKCEYCDMKLTNLALQCHMKKVHNVSIQKPVVSKQEKDQNKDKKEHRLTDDTVEVKTQPEEKSTVTKKKLVYKCPFCSLKLARLELRKHCTSEHLASEMERLQKLFHCELCSYNTDKQGCLKIHLNEHVDDAPVLKCPSCPKKFPEKSLEHHKLRAHDRMKYQCKLCSYSSQVNKTFKYHETIHERGIAIYQCAFCPKKFMALNLRTHYRETHADEHKPETVVVNADEPKPETILNKLQCQLCRYSSSKMKSMRVHLEKHIKDGDDNDVKKTYNCILCSYVGQRKKPLRQHFKLHERGDKIFDCEYCDMKLTAVALHIHCLKIHGQKITFERPAVNKCDKCSFATTNPKSMQAHKEAHFKGAPVFSCPFCPKKLTRKALKKHCLKVHKKDPGNEDKTLECPFCAKKYLYHASMKTHCEKVHKQDYDPQLKYTEPEPIVKTEDTKEEYQCKHCSYSNQFKYNLVNHMRQHEKNMPVLKCPYCPSTFTRKFMTDHCKTVHQRGFTLPNESLTEPEPIKTEENVSDVKHKCKFCSYSTYKKDNYQTHIGLHEKNAPIYECPYCPEVYTNLSLLAHCRKVHGKDPSIKKQVEIVKEETPEEDLDDSKAFKCKYCDFASVRRKSWVVHMKQHMNGAPIYDCPFCPKKYTSRCLVAHCKKIHGEKPLPVKKEEPDGNDGESLKCTSCPYMTKSSTDYKAHIKTHTVKEAVRKCRYCQKKFSESALLNHIEAVHIEEKSTIRQCNYCSYKTNCPRSLETHTKGHKLDKTVLCQCPYCDSVLANTTMTSHCRDVHKTKPLYPLQIVEDYKERPKMSCTYCPYSTKLKSKLDAHMKMVHGSGVKKESPEQKTIKGKHKCSDCSFSTNYYANLVRHMMNIHMKSKQSKEEIAKELQPGGSLEIKLSIANTYAGDTPMVPKFVIPANAVYVCEICDYTTCDKIELFKHKEKHKTNGYDRRGIKEESS